MELYDTGIVSDGRVLNATSFFIQVQRHSRIMKKSIFLAQTMLWYYKNNMHFKLWMRFSRNHFLESYWINYFNTVAWITLKFWQ